MKNLKFSVIIALLLSFMLCSAAFSNSNLYIMKPNDEGEKYKQLWAKVDSLAEEGLPKSALEVIAEIYELAKSEENTNQIIKAFIHRMMFKNNMEEYAFEDMITELKEEISKTKMPHRAIMHSMLAEMYWMYYEANRWKFANRSATVNFDNNDIKTWDLNTLAAHVIRHFNLSLQESEQLKQASTKNFDIIITKGGKPEKLRPTLYDFLAHRAIDFFVSNELSVTHPADKFEIKEDFYFTPVNEFVKIDISTQDTLSLTFQTFKIMQDLLTFRLEQKNETDALLDANIRRIKLVYEKSVHPEKDELYLKALDRLIEKHSGNPLIAQVYYAKATYYNQKSSKYNPLNKETRQFKQYKKTAHEICTKTMKKFPDSEGAKLCKQLKIELERVTISFKTEDVVMPDKPFPLKFDYKNLKKIYLRVVSIDKSKYDKLAEKNYGAKFFDKIKSKSKTVYETEYELPVDEDFNQHSVELIMKSLPIGFYVCMIANNKEFSYEKNIAASAPFYVSDISFIKRVKNDGSVDVHVLSRTTGKPLSGVNAKVWYQKYNYRRSKYDKITIGNFTTDQDGFFTIEPNKKSSYSRYLNFLFTKGNDSLTSSGSTYLYHSKQEKKIVLSTTIFTDRAIYRPGQIVYFKGIVLKSDGDKHDVIKKHTVPVTFYDVNYQKVSELKLTTNEYGTFSGSFTIPSGVLTGSFQISTPNGSKYIQVEEYKRPKFEVEMLPFKGNYLLNDTLKVNGIAKAYAGSNITDAMVSYRVVRKPVWRGWWFWDMNFNETEIVNGKTTTDDKGEFNVNFKAIPDLSMPKSEHLVFNYQIYVDVTDMNGETQSTSKSMVVGYRALQVNVDMDKTIDKTAEQEVKIITENLNGEFIPAKGNIKIFKLQEPERPLHDRSWQQPDKHLYSEDEWRKSLPHVEYADENNPVNMPKGEQVFSLNFNTKDKKKFTIEKLKKWNNGYYVVEIESKDAFGNDVLYKKFFTLYSSKGKKLPYPDDSWFSVVKNDGEPGEKAVFLIGSGYNDVSVLYEIEHKYNLVKKEWITLDNEQRRIEIPITEEHRGNFSVHFTFIKNNRFYSYSEVITVPYTNKKLDIEFATYRDKLQPGQDEQWKITVKGKQGEKVAAEMLATLYDASLDQFAVNQWYFSIYKHYYSTLSWGTDRFNTATSQVYKNDFDTYFSPDIPGYDFFNWFGFSYYRSYNLYNVGYSRRRSNVRKKSARVVAAFSEKEVAEEAQMDMFVDEVTEEDKSLIRTSSPSEAKKRNGDGEEIDFSEVKVRTNFSETAFFFPHLQTDTEGNIVINFTIPEALTRWKMKGFAHTQDLKYGFVENELVTQKDLMVLPNPPRFFRENDVIEFPVKISNISDEKLNGKAKLELLDAISMKPLHKVSNFTADLDLKDFTVDAGQNTSLAWKFEIPEGVGAITYRIVAKAGNFSDGEEKPIPVLTNSMLVTESMPMPIRSKQTKEFKFDKLVNSGSSSTLRHHKLTLEFTSNPAWYAVQALPYLMEYPYECTEQTFSRYYANSIASHIVNSSPKIKRVFEAWKTTEDSEALLSNLEKNQELKSVLLEETPWLLDGKDEGERKRRIALLFDLNRMSNELERAMRKIQQAQSGNGGFPWFKGMPESWYITQHIVCGMGHLDKLGVKDVREDTKTWKMLGNSVEYIDNQIKQNYDELKKYCKRHCKKSEEKDCYEKCLKNNHLSYMAIHYLYARSFFKDIEIPSATQQAFDYYLSQADEYWLSQSKYMQGMLALALHRFGNEKTPEKIIKSLKEHAIQDEEMGMYWKDVSAGYYWYQAPIETQALLIETFDEVANDREAVDGMKVWLLKQKQTQDWKTTKATVEAVYALLLEGTDWLASDEMVEITVGKQKIDPKKMPEVKVEAGTGYFKTSWTGQEIKPAMGKVTVTKPNEGVSWGALYWQYFEQLDKITPHETPLSLKKELFLEKDTKQGKVIEPVSAGAELNVGDKIIVRIELRVDRSMEYVHLKDMRASGFEPVNVISRYKYQDGLGYYEATRDASTNFFISWLGKGTYVFEYPLRVSHRGDFSNGITTIQCMYAPEFASHSEGVRVEVR